MQYEVLSPSSRGTTGMPELFPFQRKDVARSLVRNVLIASECGIGKTMEMISVVKQRREVTGEVGPVLVLCNNRAKAQWKAFIEEWDPGIPIVVTGRGGKWPDDEIAIEHWFHPRHPGYVIGHHEAMSLPRSKKAREQRKYNAPKVWSRYAWEHVIVDECHRYKGRKSMRAVALRGIIGLHKMCASGTIMDDSPAQMWVTLNYLYPSLFPAYWAFVEDWIEIEENYLGYRNLKGIKPGKEEEFANLLAPFTIHRRKRDPDVKPDLPPVRRETLPLQMEKGTAQYRAYEEIGKAKDIEVKFPEDLAAGEWHLLIKNTLARIVRLQQVLADPRLLGLRGTSVKLEWIKDYVFDNPNESIVVFTKFRNVALVLAEDLDGAISIGGKTERYEEWQAGKVKVLCGTIKAIGESLNLQKASTAIFVTREWSSIAMTQAFDRIDRIDITEPKHLIFLQVLNSIDGLVDKALKEKWTEQQLVWEYLRKAQAQPTKS